MVCLTVAGSLIPLQFVPAQPDSLTQFQRIRAVYPMACSPAVEVCAVPNGDWETLQATN